MQVQGFFHADTATVTYGVFDPVTRAAALIDTVLDYEPASGKISTTFADRLIAWLDSHALRLEWLLETHIHADHLSAARYLRERRGGRIGIGSGVAGVLSYWQPVFGRDDIPGPGQGFDAYFSDGERLALGELSIEVLVTPGHTDSCVSYRIGDAVFVGDTLFMPDVGTARTDFPGGDPAVQYRSLRRLLALPESTVLYTGHDYPPDGREVAWASTVAEQRRSNRLIHDGVSEADYVANRRARDEGKPAPRLLLPSLQVNLRAGGLGEVNAQGRKTLTIPLRGDWLG